MDSNRKPWQVWEKRDQWSRWRGGERKAKDEMAEAYAEDDQDKKGRPCRRWI